MRNARSIAVGFVTYRPDESFFKRLALCRDAGLHVYLFDNSPELPFTQPNDQLTRTYITSGKNVGIGFALSTICATAQSHGYRRLLFLDQDTVFTPGTLAFIERTSADPLIFDASLASLTYCADDLHYRVVDVLFAISSGTVFDLGHARALGFHDCSFFVDGVDYEYCLRARKARLRVGRFGPTPGFDHTSQQADEDKTVFGRPMRLRRYPLSRIRDASSAYLRLLGRSAAHGDFGAVVQLLRSFAIYVSAQVLARLVL